MALSIRQRDIMAVMMSQNIQSCSDILIIVRTKRILGSMATEEEIDKTFEKFKQVRKIRKMFDEVNDECSIREEGVVTFTDTAYYTEQIINIFELEHNEAKEIASYLGHLN